MPRSGLASPFGRGGTAKAVTERAPPALSFRGSPNGADVGISCHWDAENHPAKFVIDRFREGQDPPLRFLSEGIAAERPCLSLWERWHGESRDGEGILSSMGIATPVCALVRNDTKPEGIATPEKRTGPQRHSVTKNPPAERRRVSACRKSPPNSMSLRTSPQAGVAIP